MNRLGYVIASLKFHWRTHLGVLLGAMIATAVIVGALVVGDSIRGSLKQMALQRLGGTHYAMHSGDRLFGDGLGNAMLSKAHENNKAFEGLEIVPVLQLQGMAAKGDGSQRVGDVVVNGVNDAFWAFNDIDNERILKGKGVVINQRMGDTLGVGVGDELLLRFHKPSALPRDVPLGSDADESVTLRAKVDVMLPDHGIGRFSLRVNQVPPLNVFVPLKLLQEKSEVQGRANMLLVSGEVVKEGDKAGSDVLMDVMREAITLGDVQFEVRELKEQGVVEVRSDRIFMGAVEMGDIDAMSNALGLEGVKLLTYFVNEIKHGEEMVPYSMISAMQAEKGGVASRVPEGLGDDEIILNEWTAKQLGGITVDEEVKLKYFVIDPRRGLVEQERAFKLKAIVPNEGKGGDRELMPNFPGLAGADSSFSWSPGIPIDFGKIDDEDDDYWAEYKGTPKAFVNLNVGQGLWGNRFGNVTAVRFAYEDGLKEQIVSQLKKEIDPVELQMVFMPVREQALIASREGYDFGQLFLGFSFFLVLAAVVLTGLLFVFGAEQRAREMGTMLAIGFDIKLVKQLMLKEGVILAIGGSVLGVLLGMGYTKLMLLGLGTLWEDAVGTSALSYHASSMSLGIGVGSGVLVAVLAMMWVLRKVGRRPIRELLTVGLTADASKVSERGRVGKWVMLVSGVSGVVLFPVGMYSVGEAAAGSFFGSGFLLLTCFIAGCGQWVGYVGGDGSVEGFNRTGLARRNNARRIGRTLATVTLLAAGSFLVAAVGVFRLDPSSQLDRDGGTGGFSLIAESSLPVLYDLNTKEGVEYYQLLPKNLEGVEFVPMKVRDGDDASCLNLNQAQAPRMLGVNATQLQERGAFTFVAELRDEDEGSEGGWGLLKKELGEGVVPGVVDHATLIWALKKKPGDVIEYQTERGDTLKVKVVGTLANSILQGVVIVDESVFLEAFPSIGGYKYQLIETPAGQADEVGEMLAINFRDQGMSVTTTQQRLALFNEVQNTYLGIFQVLGGLGLVLGCAGLGMVVLRNVLERRAELATMRAMGFSTQVLQGLLYREHGMLLVMGVVIGVVSAAVAVLPRLLEPGQTVPLGVVGLTVLGVFVSGWLWIWIATKVAMRGELMRALRNE